MADGVPQLPSRAAALMEIARRFIKYGSPDRAKQISSENLQIISTIRDESTRAAAIANLSELYEDASMQLNPAEMEITRTLLRKHSF